MLKKEDLAVGQVYSIKTGTTYRIAFIGEDFVGFDILQMGNLKRDVFINDIHTDSMATFLRFVNEAELDVIHEENRKQLAIRKHAIATEKVICKCGCGKEFNKYDQWGHEREYINTHQSEIYQHKMAKRKEGLFLLTNAELTVGETYTNVKGYSRKLLEINGDRVKYSQSRKRIGKVQTERPEKIFECVLRGFVWWVNKGKDVKNG